MKVNYIVLFDDSVESYCQTMTEVKRTIDEMVEMYSCDSLSEKIIRKDAKIYQVKKVNLKGE